MGQYCLHLFLLTHALQSALSPFTLCENYLLLMYHVRRQQLKECTSATETGKPQGKLEPPIAPASHIHAVCWALSARNEHVGKKGEQTAANLARRYPEDS